MKKYFSSDIINPVFLKELRQFFRGRTLGYIAAGLLIGQLCCFAIVSFMMRNGFPTAAAGAVISNLWLKVIMYVVIGIAAIVVPMQRFCRERQTPELDYSLVTMLRPMQIIFGKVLSGLFCILYINLLSLPIIFWGVYACEIEWKSIVSHYFTYLPIVILTLLSGIFCGSTGRKWVQGIFLLILFQVIAPLTIAAGRIDMKQADLLSLAVWEMILFLFIVSAAVLTPAYANRMWYPRIFLTLLYLLLPAVLMWIVDDAMLYQIAMGCHFLLIISLLCLLTLCDREEPGLRVMSRAPRRWPARMLYQMFSSSRAGGMFLSCAVYAVFMIFLLIRHNSAAEVRIMQLYSAIAGYVIFYTQLALLLQKFTGKGHPLLWFTVAGCLLGLATLFFHVPGFTYIQIGSPYFLAGSQDFFDPKLWCIPLLTLVLSPLFLWRLLKQK